MPFKLNPFTARLDWTEETIFPTYTQGSVLFAGVDGLPTQDNANFFYNDSLNRLGLGTTTPARTLDILNNSEHQFRLSVTDTSVYCDFRLHPSNGILYVQPTGGTMQISTTFVGGNVGFVGQNLDNTNTASHASLQVQSGGASGGDAYMFFSVLGVTNWVAGVDNSDSDKFKISASGALGTSDVATFTTTGLVGVGTTGPDARLVVAEETIGSDVLGIYSLTSVPDYVRSMYRQNRVTTTNATLTTILTLALTASRTYWCRAIVTARRTGGTAGTAEDGATYVITASYKVVGGNATIIGAVSADFTAEDQAGWTATFNVSSGNVLVQVTGAVDNNITWHCTLNYGYVNI